MDEAEALLGSCEATACDADDEATGAKELD